MTEQPQPWPTVLYGRASTTISGELIANVRLLLAAAWQDVADGRTQREGTNAYTHHAPPAFISAVAAVEAFMNESFLAMPWFGTTALQVVPREWLERVDITIKLLLVPQLALGKTLDRGAQPYQDMAGLIKLRNELVHYKMGASVPKIVLDLARKGIALRLSGDETQDGITPWADRVSTSAAIRWAHNTACETVRAIAALVPESPQRGIHAMATGNFRPVSDDDARRALTALGVVLLPDERSGR